MTPYDKYKAELSKLSDIRHAIGVLHWDTEVNMPVNGAQVRAQQIGTLASLAHGMFTDDKTGRMLEELGADESLTPEQSRNVFLTNKDYQKQIKLSSEFVREMSMAKSIAFNEWVKAKRAEDFSLFRDSLSKLVDLKRRETELRGYDAEPYDALLDNYEPGLRAARVVDMFDEAKRRIIPLTKQIQARPSPERSFLTQNFPEDSQWDFGLEVLQRIGYDFGSGRQDKSPHPFTISFHPQDVRVTTHINEHDFMTMLWSCLHEAGHAMYEQGLAVENYGLPAGSAASLAIHESQSRLWENHVGRSSEFWDYWYPILQKRFPDNLGGIPKAEFYRAINTIKPNLIRIEADELNYHLHVIIRFEIERGLINGEIEVDQLPENWNDRYREYLGVDVPSDGLGVLQDVHWSHGSFGYFPTYSMGSFYAAQIFAAAVRANPTIPEEIQLGKYSTLLTWLRNEIHCHGRIFDPEDLCIRVTGESLNVDHFVNYATGKFGAIYGL